MPNCPFCFSANYLCLPRVQYFCCLCSRNPHSWAWSWRMSKLLLFTIISKNCQCVLTLKKIFCCLTKCCVAHAGFCFCTKSVCVWLMTSVCSVCTVAQPCNALKTFHHNEMHFQLLYWFFVFCFGRSRQIFPAFVQVPSVPLTILTHKHMGTTVVTVKLKLSTKSVRVIHTENMMYTSFLNSLGVNCYLLKLKCTKFTFCELIILKFRICVCVCRGG